MGKNETIDGFMDKVFPCPITGCWLWAAFVNPDGYGMVTVGSKSIRAHRQSYQLFVGPIPDGKQLDHLCRVRRCVNPHHLEAVDGIENWRRGESSSKLFSMRDKCANGHDLTGDNLMLYRGARRCKACNAKDVERYRSKNIETLRHKAREYMREKARLTKLLTKP